MLGVGTISEELCHAVDDGGELVVVERPDQDAAGVAAIGFGPLSEQGSEIPRVAGDQDAILLSREFEDLRIIESPQRSIGGQAQDVVAALFEGGPDALR